MDRDPINKSVRWWQRPSGRIIAEIDVLCVMVIVVIMISPSLAATLIPIPLTTYVIDLGDVPPWIAAFVISITWWEARAARKNAAKAQAAATAAIVHIEVVRAQTDGIMTKIATMSKSEGKVEGRQEVVAEVAAAKVVAREDAVADARAAAKVESVRNIAVAPRVIERGAESPRLSPGVEMPKKIYQGKEVTVVRDARNNDPGFDPGKPGQLIIKLADGTEKTVQSSDLKDA